VASVVIGSERDNHVGIDVLARPNAASPSPWDHDWLTVRIRVAGGAFSGGYEATIRTHDLARFRGELADLHGRLSGTATFSCDENWLHLEVKGDGRGHIDVRCEARDDPTFGACLQYTIAIDQTYLPKVLAELDEVLAHFPVLQPYRTA